MTADGNWNLAVSTPMGERQATLSVKTEGTTLKGSQAADGNSTKFSTVLSMVMKSLGRSRSPTRCQ
jgi:hypothetical protein